MNSRKSSSMATALCLRTVFQWFLQSMSVRLIIAYVMLVQFSGNALLLRYRIQSSYTDHEALIIIGLSWLFHLSLIYFPLRLVQCLDKWSQFCGPFLETSLTRLMSSAMDQERVFFFVFIWLKWFEFKLSDCLEILELTTLNRGWNLTDF